MEKGGGVEDTEGLDFQHFHVIFYCNNIPSLFFVTGLYILIDDLWVRFHL